MRRGLKVKRAGTSFREAGPHPAVEERLEQGSALGETRLVLERGEGSGSEPSSTEAGDEGVHVLLTRVFTVE